MLFFLTVGGIFVILLLAAFSIMEETNFVLGCVFALFDIFLLGGALYSVRKKLKSCPVILSSDSHGKEHVGEVSEALKLIAEFDFPPKLVSF